MSTWTPGVWYGVRPAELPPIGRSGSGFMLPSARPGRQREAKYGTAARVGIDPQPSAMSFNDRVANRKPKAHAVRLGRDESAKKAVRDLGRETRAGVGYGDFHQLGSAGRRCDRELRATTPGRRT